MNNINKVIPARGSWFINFNGEKLACVHRKWYHQKGRNAYYFDPGAKLDEKQWEDFVAGIKSTGKVMLTSGKQQENGTFSRTGYIDTYEVANVIMDETGLRFDFTKRLNEVHKK